MTEYPNNDEPLDIDRLIEESLNDPEVQALQAAMEADAARFRSRSLFQLFRDITDAESLEEPELSDFLRSRAATLYGDAALSHDLLDAVGAILDEPELAVEDALLAAADPRTGRLPPGFQLPPDLQAVLDASPGLQAFRDDLPSIITGGDEAAQIRETAAYMLQTYATPHRMSIEITLPVATGDAALVDHGMTLRDAVSETGEETETPGDMQPGDVISRYFEDAQGHYRLEASRRLREDGRFDLWLRLREPGSGTLMVTNRADWRVIATLGDAELALTADDLYTDAWRLADPLDEEQLKRIAYDVSLSP